ncbi:hydantoinase B/oxoprolinase family protein [Paraburkholderia sp. CNPSo 3281]|uniref:hydantoinase B/oxoprolinase family protein n=1 Tax=Paraburkholderia sp. CNPSo 3281 TaxID=2940933 RepID=UPI0020B86FFF|nr:hydantoinase B/oxoprolinase family protein [Paraburkholderia sp. CNPSo 3281]MCP3715463.1 hydantoinase B/oxoprolinase family protein [Paraburkholderia sp. CNPSo 3281]
MARDVDPITLAVVRGVLETTQREMTMTLEKTARSSVFNVAHDYSNAIFNERPESDVLKSNWTRSFRRRLPPNTRC